MGLQIERVIDGTNFALGEGPHWDVDSQSLYFVDIFEKSINKYDPATKKTTKAKFKDGNDSISFVIPIEGSPGKFVISLGRKIVAINWDGVCDKFDVTKTFGEVDVDIVTNRLNDGKCDNFGKLWTGTMGSDFDGKVPRQHAGSLFSVEGVNNLKKQASKITIANGLAWSADNKHMYYIDSWTKTVDQFDYSGSAITNRKSIFSFEKFNIPGFPDGMCIDSDGNLWVAVFKGSRIIKIDPRIPETLLDTINLPALQVTSVAFGGKDLDELYATSARITSMGDEAAPNPPENGATYKITGLGVKGLPGTNFKML